MFGSNSPPKDRRWECWFRTHINECTTVGWRTVPTRNIAYHVPPPPFPFPPPDPQPFLSAASFSFFIGLWGVVDFYVPSASKHRTFPSDDLSSWFGGTRIRDQALWYIAPLVVRKLATKRAGEGGGGGRWGLPRGFCMCRRGQRSGADCGKLEIQLKLQMKSYVSGWFSFALREHRCIRHPRLAAARCGEENTTLIPRRVARRETWGIQPTIRTTRRPPRFPAVNPPA